MNEPASTTRRTLLKGGAASLAAPAVVTIAQADTATAPKEAATFNLWVMSDCHVGTDKAASEAILHGLAWFDELECYAMLLGPVSQRDSDELWAVVCSQLEGIAADSGYALKHPHHSFSGQAEINFDPERFPVEVVDHIESAKATTIP